MNKRIITVILIITMLIFNLVPLEANAASGTKNIVGFSVSYNVIIRNNNKTTTAQLSSPGTSTSGSVPTDIFGSVYMVVRDSDDITYTLPTVTRSVEYGEPLFILTGIGTSPASVVWSVGHYSFLGTSWTLNAYPNS